MIGIVCQIHFAQLLFFGLTGPRIEVVLVLLIEVLLPPYAASLSLAVCILALAKDEEPRAWLIFFCSSAQDFANSLCLAIFFSFKSGRGAERFKGI